jgi:hypothetical protein
MKFYARVSNNILQQGYGLDELSFEVTKEQYPDDLFLEVDCLCDPYTHYFKDGAIVKKPEKPSSSCFWNDVTLSWVENEQLKEVEVKGQRNTLLSASDWTQIPNNALTPEKQAAWATYRQELRDVSQQSGYPFNVVWPVAPI